MRGAPPRRTAACARRPLRHGSIGARFASRHCKNEAFFLYPHTSHLSHHSNDPLCRQHKVWLRLRSPTQHARPPHRRPLSSPPRRMARSADHRLSSPEAVAATSLGHSGPSAAMSPRTSSAASPKFTPAALAEGRRCRGAGSSGSGGAESGRLLLAARFLAAAAGLLERAAAAGGSSS